ncbi:hypothetical protein OIE66_08025 [Nonomuraea sp. NBC_01738]|uniref:hypothetical protein n=1 Tax=Nonomuraea sp. NBC_01738 TaxID=2976003 RepID=UPI002E0E7951|nr:hypothetical protein OIE66_08025 [Nonomuraea sp. NBC_01738]
MNDRIACEDVLLFVNAAITSTSQREFHSTAGEQRLSLAFLHDYIRVNYREVYAAALALDINDHNAALIITNLLTGRATEREGRLIARRLAAMPPQRVYRLFGDLRSYGVNNRRTRAIIRDWLAARPDLAFDAVKYRSGLKRAVRHAHLKPPGELPVFLFGDHTQAAFQTPILDTWRRAHFDRRAIAGLPYTVAEGFAARRGIAREEFMTTFAPRLTRLERLRLDRDPDLAAMPLVRLAAYALAPPYDKDKAVLDAALRAAAARVAGERAGTWGRVAAVLDDSYSASGSAHKRRRPLAVALACHYLLDALAGDFTPFWLGHDGHPSTYGPAARPRSAAGSRRRWSCGRTG